MLCGGENEKKEISRTNQAGICDFAGADVALAQGLLGQVALQNDGVKVFDHGEFPTVFVARDDSSEACTSFSPRIALAIHTGILSG